METLAKDSLLAQIGGETVLRGLVNSFYDLIETDPRGKSLLRLHFRGHSVDHAREEQFNFLCGFLGGRRHYLEKHGHMDVRRMHEHVPISAADAEDWLALMEQAMVSMQMSGPPADNMRAAFRHVALALVNDLGEWGMQKQSANDLHLPAASGASHGPAQR